MGKPFVTGIDIGHRSLKAVILKPYGEHYALLGYKEIIIKDGIFSDNHTLNHQEIVNSLKELKKELPLFRYQVSLAVPDSSVISKMLSIDAELDGREREFAILQAFAHQSPFPVDELSIDYVQLVEETSKTNHSYQVYATKKEVVESRVRVAEEVGLKPVLVDVHAHSLCNILTLAAERHPDKASYCLLDVGYDTTSLVMSRRNEPPLVKEFAYGVSHLNASIGDDLTSPDAHEKTDIFNIELTERVRRQLQLFQSMDSQSKVNGLWICGEGAITPLLSETLQRKLSLECEVLNPLALFEQKTAKRKRRIVDWHHFSVAAGLAIGGIQWLEDSHAA
ncbi:type IV pilus assembly protein PilM [Vibrio vulnificus]|uniref:type IV pilus assembly protein PilM n=1 Tax=Vibrio vulnificus TaxID=672 RepID=UPI000CD24BEB|nr:type IV pilus assembly protein PilM [Vibrio vulnificus]AVX00654.1 pilus assembly protein PilM [Vibrio vulnificus Env1]EHY0958887.1 type IV pilus assembly protein PilM [Vibrio vulnificus]POC65271.1 pilus assembly protein PilM [Vibrio vulnificus Env1]